MTRLIFVLVVLSISKGNALKCYQCDDLLSNEPDCDDVIKEGVLTECPKSTEGDPYCDSLDGTENVSGALEIQRSLRRKSCSHIDKLKLQGRQCIPFNRTEVNGILVGTEQKLETYVTKDNATLCLCNDYNGCNGSVRPMVALWSIVASLVAAVKFIN
ncbi:uncharacterized protein LOC117301495 [Asterias rubens]|uniref:uncharacterized protein LOC117301495 n=1 Tax=Asterias rubens TaxID=7604 RepID=UPI00145516FB|nr:uncharacterized protein LOC117301495 [Asterias rubens]